MRHALLSRFQGTLLAAALGNELGVYSRSRQVIPQNGIPPAAQTASLTVATLANWHPGLEPSGGSQPLSCGGKVATRCARALVEAGGWQEQVLTAIGGQSATLEAAGSLSAELAIATLPIALFFHDEATRQQQRLLQTIKHWHDAPSLEAGLLVVGYAIAQVLQERLEPQILLPQSIAYLKQSTATPTTSLLELVGTLEQTQTLLQQGAGLSTAIERLAKENHVGNRAIALAFYCFLSTPDDLRLALLRAARCGESAPIVGALTGAVSGAHHGISGLPLAWQLADASLPSWGITTVELCQLATHLFAAWSGVYTPAMPMDAVAIAAPGVIRPR